ncbi:hypothetical protein V3C99_006375, partial [Haemonchus contortus]
MIIVQQQSIPSNKPRRAIALKNPKEDDHSPTKDPTDTIKHADSSRGPKNDQSATEAPIKQTKRSDSSV